MKTASIPFVPPWLTNPITIPVQPPGWQEPPTVPNWLRRDLGYEATTPTTHPNWRLTI